VDLHGIEEAQPNLRAALSWLLENSEGEQALRAVAGVCRYWLICGPLGEGQRWTEAALANASAEPSRDRAAALSYLGEFHFMQGDLDRAEALKQEAIAVARSVSERRVEAAALHDLGEMAQQRGDLERSLGLHRQSLALRREDGEPLGIAHALSGVGSVALSEGRLDEARHIFEEIVEIGARENSLEFRAYGLLSLGEAMRRQRRLLDAKALFQEGLALIGDPMDVELFILAVEGLAAVAVEEGSRARAARLFGAAETIRRSISLGPDYASYAEYGPLRAGLRDDHGSLGSAWAAGCQMPPDQVLTYALASAAAT
jgi:tetratricopeptide (TPR) repeat protein